jgi:putative oxidoreductase
MLTVFSQLIFVYASSQTCGRKHLRLSVKRHLNDHKGRQPGGVHAVVHASVFRSILCAHAHRDRLLISLARQQKLLSVPPPPSQLPSFVIAIAGPIELIGGTLVMIGLFTGWAAFLCSGLMAFAYWMVHGTQALLPIENKGELAALYCFVFLYISSQGSGMWSLDSARGKV